MFLHINQLVAYTFVRKAICINSAICVGVIDMRKHAACLLDSGEVSKYLGLPVRDRIERWEKSHTITCNRCLLTKEGRAKGEHARSDMGCCSNLERKLPSKFRDYHSCSCLRNRCLGNGDWSVQSSAFKSPRAHDIWPRAVRIQCVDACVRIALSSISNRLFDLFCQYYYYYQYYLNYCNYCFHYFQFCSFISQHTATFIIISIVCYCYQDVANIDTILIILTSFISISLLS